MLPVTLDLLLHGDGKSAKKHSDRCVECSGPTKGGKPWCTEHIMLSPYAAKLVNALNSREQEIEHVRRFGRGAIKPDSQILQDILALLKVEGSKSLARLARDLKGIDISLLMHYAERLSNHGKISLVQTQRGRWMLHLVGYKNPLAHLIDDENDDDEEDDEEDENVT